KDTIPVPGTAIDGAIALAEEVYAQTSNQKLLFLFSDGEELADSAVAGAQRAKEKNICIYTIGIGSAEGSMIPISAPKTGKVEFLRDRSGQIVKTALDEKTLKEIATATEGHYAHLSAAGLTNLQKNITSRFPLLKKSSPENTYLEKVYQERYQPFLLLGFLLLLLEMLIGTYKKPEKYTVSIYYRLSLILLFFSIFLPDRLLARDSQGEIFYKNGAFGEALEFYNRELEKRKDDPELLYNKGTTCLALGHYEEAGQAFKAASAHAPVELQRKIFYNSGNALFGQGKSLPDPKATLAAWNESLRHFRSAADLDERFEEAKKNARYVEEEIKKLEDQQNPNNQENPKDKKDSKDQQNPDDQNQQDNQKDQQNSNNQENPDDKKDSKDQQNPGDKNQQDNQKDQQNPNNQDNPEDKKDSKDQQNPDDKKQQDNQKDQQNSNNQENPEDKKDSKDQQNPDDKNQQDNQKDQQNPNNQENSEDKKNSKDQQNPDENPNNNLENQPENSKMTKGEALQLLNSLENNEKKLPSKLIYGNIKSRDPEKFW
ncbi:MAG: tetratricopeptide repeat protein, partial [Puniceicoccales bacterium]|nr:tetratricopeptide repeat protein [Puniceicoccales bacterium]